MGNSSKTEQSSRPNTSMTRRKFVQGAAAGVGLTLGGARIFAEPSLPQHDAAATNNPAKNFVYGTHFYHPESGPRPEQFRSMIDTIANKYQFNIIRIYPPWDYYNQRPGEFQFDDLEQLMSVCDEYGMRVLMGIYLESSPYWLEEAHQETRLVNAKGQAMHLGADGGSYSGGWPNLCMDWEVVQEAASRFVHELVKISAPHRSLYAYDVWNEPYLVRGSGTTDPNAWVAEKMFCYCDRTIAEFQTWLQRKYGTLDQINDAWIRRYPDWKSIDPPRVPIEMYTDFMDWRQFIQDRTASYMKFRVKNVRDIDAGHILESHSSHLPPIVPATLGGTQNWRLAEALDVFGLSYYPNRQKPESEGFAQMEVTRSCAAGKDFWVTEMAGNHFNAGYRQGTPVRAREIRMQNWMALVAGARGIVYWTYLTEGTGREAGGYGLVERSGATTERAEEAARTNRLIQSRWKLISEYRPSTEVAILFDQDNALLTFAMGAAEEPSTESASGYYKAFWDMDLLADFIEPAGIETSHHKVLIVPWHLIGKKSTCAALQSFAEKGGTVVVESGFARFSESYYLNPVIPNNGLDTIFGYQEKDSITITDGKLPLEALDQAPSGAKSFDADLSFVEPVAVNVRATAFLTPIELGTAKAIAKCGHWTVASMKSVGEGKIYYIGTSLGRSIYAGYNGGIELLRGIVSSSVKPRTTSVGKLRPRLIEVANRGAILTVFNETPEDQTGSISVPSTYRRATEIYSGKSLPVIDGRITIQVPFKEVAVLDLE